MPDRVYSEREVAAIIQRAAESQRTTPDRSDAPGLTLAEIERVGREAGLDPALLRSAASDLDAGALALDGRRSRTAVAERWVEAPFSPDAWEDAVASLRLSFGASSQGWTTAPDIAQVGRGHEWSHRSLSGATTTVSASPRGDRTRLRVVREEEGLANDRLQETLVGGFLGLVIGVIGGAVVAETLGFGDLWGVVFVVATLALGLGLGATVLTERTRRRRAQHATNVQRLADDLAQRFSAMEPPLPPNPLAEPVADDLGTGRIDDEWMTETPDPEAPSAETRRVRS